MSRSSSTSAPEMGAQELQGLYCEILGVKFFTGEMSEAIQRMSRGGLLVVPAAPALKDIGKNSSYREALLQADVVIPDSGLMVLVWNLLERAKIRRLSGLTYLRELFATPWIRNSRMFWIMASPESSKRNLEWLKTQGFAVAPEDVYLAPMYSDSITDTVLLERLGNRRPHDIFVTLGGGVQESLGLYLKRNLDYTPAIHCTGAAIAFLSGDQVSIPRWADRFFLGWLLRCLSSPTRYVPRYWNARKLVGLIFKYRHRMPLITA